MTTYFPSLLLMMIIFATTFFKPFFFEAALSVNLTTMLVMTTIFISKMEGLPPTSATKMIDYWLILWQLVPFAEVVLLTAMESLREEEDGKRTKMKKAAKTKTKIGKNIRLLLSLKNLKLIGRCWIITGTQLTLCFFQKKREGYHCVLFSARSLTSE